MNTRFTLESALDKLCSPTLIQLQKGLIAAQFDLMKIVPARSIVEQALRSGILKPGDPVIESSSGTFGLGLAIVCAHYGLPLTLVTGPLEKIQIRLC